MAPWKKVGSREIYRAQTPDEISVVSDQIELAGGARFNYVFAHSPYEVVFVVGIDPGGNMILLRQHRYLAEDYLIEIPAGSPNDGESLEDGARREFEEEAGYSVGRLEKIAEFFPSIGITDQINHVYVGWDLRETRQRLEKTEDISSFRVSIDEAVDMVYEGKIISGGAAYSILRAARWWETMMAPPGKS
ncbi:MAG: NUDIX domain-containing protein [Frankia sp.]